MSTLVGYSFDEAKRDAPKDQGEARCADTKAERDVSTTEAKRDEPTDAVSVLLNVTTAADALTQQPETVRMIKGGVHFFICLQRLSTRFE